MDTGNIVIKNFNIINLIIFWWSLSTGGIYIVYGLSRKDASIITPALPPPPSSPASSSLCQQSKVAGPCRGIHRRWYYNSRFNRCLRFVYGGCRGNANNFNTSQLCQEACGGAPPHSQFEAGSINGTDWNTTTCFNPNPLDPAAAPTCSNSSSSTSDTFWYFNSTTSTCQRFELPPCRPADDVEPEKTNAITVTSRLFKFLRECAIVCGHNISDVEDQFYDEEYYGAVGGMEEADLLSWPEDDDDYEEEEEGTDGGLHNVPANQTHHQQPCFLQTGNSNTTDTNIYHNSSGAIHGKDSTPNCTQYGFFQPAQCNFSSGYCRCVDPENGEPVDGNQRTEEIGGHWSGKCGACHEFKAARVLTGRSLIGAFIPQCDEYGLYRPLQCHSSNGSCWCVDPGTGEKVNGTAAGDRPVASAADCEPAVPASTSAPSTTSSPTTNLDESINASADTSQTETVSALGGPTIGRCAQERNRAGDKPAPGAFLPKCVTGGYYDSVQCDPSTGHCWCVEPETGAEVFGTRMPGGEGKPTCRACHVRRLKGLVAARLSDMNDAAESSSGAEFAPQCDPNGNFLPVQINSSDGHVWCVDPTTGLEIAGSKRGPGAGLPVCSGPSSKPVSAKIQDIIVPNVFADVREKSSLAPNATRSPQTPTTSAASESDSSTLSSGDYNQTDNNANNYCALPMETGSCRSRMTRWYFDSNYQTCLAFIYGGCGGNSNNFETRGKCTFACYKADSHLCFAGRVATALLTGSLVNTRKKSCTKTEQCPGGFVCRVDASRGVCCNSTLEAIYQRSINPRCSIEGGKVSTTPQDGLQWPILGHDCNSTPCPDGSKCEHPDGALFSYCCSTTSAISTTRNSSATTTWPPIITNTPSSTVIAPSNANIPQNCLFSKNSGFHNSRRTLSSSTSGSASPQRSWYFDSNTRTCVQYNWAPDDSRGSGNNNNFPSEKACQDTCLVVYNSTTATEATKSGVNNNSTHDKQSKSSSNSSATQQFNIDPPPADDDLLRPDTAPSCSKKLPSTTNNCPDSKLVTAKTFWYYNEDKAECFAYAYRTCGNGNGNGGVGFESKTDCDVRCKPLDGPTCSGKGYTTPIGGSSPGQSRKKDCSTMTCPEGYRCQMGWLFPSCCNVTIEDAYEAGYSPVCPNGADSYTVDNGERAVPFFGDTCPELICPSGYECLQVNEYFAKCCSISPVHSEDTSGRTNSSSSSAEELLLHGSQAAPAVVVAVEQSRYDGGK